MADPPPQRVTALTLARAAADFQRVTTQLIGLLLEQSRAPTPERAELIAKLEVERDAAHEHLNQVEAAYGRVGQR